MMKSTSAERFFFYDDHHVVDRHNVSDFLVDRHGLRPESAACASHPDARLSTRILG